MAHGEVDGLENHLVNEVTLANDWKVLKSWKFKKESHINFLELRAVERLVEERAKSGPIRFLNLVDSNVARCALGKGRSASKGEISLQKGILRRVSARTGRIWFVHGQSLLPHQAEMCG